MMMILMKMRKIDKPQFKKIMKTIESKELNEGHRHLIMIYKAFTKFVLSIEIVYNKEILTFFFVKSPVCDYLNLKQR